MALSYETARELVLSQFIIGEPSNLFESFLPSISNHHVVGPIIEAFRENLNAVIATSNVPFILTQASAYRERFNQLHIAARIRNRPIIETSGAPEVDEPAALTEANKNFSLDVKTKEFQDAVSKQIVFELHGYLQDAKLAHAFADLLRQTAVMIWTAFEVAATDLAVSILNHSPSLSVQLLKSKFWKDRSGARIVDVEVLENFGFDLSGEMGTIIFNNVRLDKFENIREVYDLLFHDGALNKSIRSEILWIMCQRRNLIVHRRGIVDVEYLSKTSDNFAVGTVIKLTPSEVELYLTTARDVVLTMATAAINCPALQPQT